MQPHLGVNTVRQHHMSKKKPTRKAIKPTKRKPVRAKSATSQPTPTPVAPTTVQDGFWRKMFGYTLGAMAIIMVALALNSGINGDDEYQNDYSSKLVSYYSTMGSDTSALYIEKGNMHYYGGFFDLLTGVVNSALGLDEFDTAYHQVRHFFNAVFGLLAMFFVGLLVRELAGWRAAVLALWILFLSPRFLGHSLMNPKDIPFAAGFAIALYYMIRLFRSMPQPSWKTALGLALGIALALATRAGGLLLIAYLGLFAGLDFLFRYGFAGLRQHTQILGRYVAYSAGAVLVGYILAVLTWPAALVDPIGHPLAALTEFSKLGVKIRLLFMGENLLSDDTAWYYAPLWIMKTIPLFVLVGFIGSIFFLLPWLKQYGRTEVLLLFFATLFPVAYVIYKDSILHDGWRHLMFVYPSMAAIATLFWISVERLVQKTSMRYVVWGVLGLMALESTVFIVRNYEFPYVYFNPIGGGLSGAFGAYETDYWGISVKEAIDWMDQEGIISPDMPDTLVMGTTFYYNLSRQTREQYNGKIKMKYVRFNTRYSEDWDYGVFPSRFIRSEHLSSGKWPNSKSIHTVEANGVPLLSIEKNTTKDAYLGQQALKNQQWQQAKEYLEAELEAHPDNELAWIGLSNTYLSTGQFAQALEAADQALAVAPAVESALLYKGMALLNLKRYQEAVGILDKATRVNEEYYIAYYYKALAYDAMQDAQNAFDAAQKAIEARPNFKAGYELAAKLLEKAGDTANAARYREAAKGL